MPVRAMLVSKIELCGSLRTRSPVGMRCFMRHTTSHIGDSRCHTATHHGGACACKYLVAHSDAVFLGLAFLNHG